MYTHKAKPDAPVIEAPVQQKSADSGHVQHLNYAEGTQALNPTHKPDYDTQQAALEPAVQRKGEGPVQRDVHEAAKRGISGSGASLPYLDAIQHSFGRHDVSGISAYTGGSAADACHDMGAQAYATGNAVAFGSSPDLHTAAHEAAHVVQQRAGVSLRGGVGAAGDTYEQHADRVADQVVQGKSAESLLDKFAGPGVQQSNAVQKRENTPETTDPVAELGNRLWREFPNGVSVSLYDPDDT